MPSQRYSKVLSVHGCRLSCTVMATICFCCVGLPHLLPVSLASVQSAVETKREQEQARKETVQDKASQKDESKDGSNEWQVLFNGKNLNGWEKTNFGTGRPITVVNKELRFEMGYPMTGITSTLSDIPKKDFEISLEAKRRDGIDFFCGLTFPVNDSHCSLIVGGWGGTLVGLSCIDGKDAAHNDTKSFMNFEADRWYKIRVKVLAQRIQVSIDGKSVVDRDITGCKISVRNETLKSRPLGVCSFETDISVRNFKIRNLQPQHK